jgi:SAM-dependent methyltransferase
LGIGRGAIALLLEEAAARPFSGKVATLGRQTIAAAPHEISAQFARFGVSPHAAIEHDRPDDHALFGMMGFDSVESLDYSDFEGATHVVDLNSDGLPPDLIGRFDVVLDSGTIEHVFHIPNALRNALSLAKEGGRVIFISPSSNHVDHGFYMFSPTLFMDYMLANGLRVETCYFIRYSPDTRRPWRAYNYDRESWRTFEIGALDGRPYMIFVVATRVPGSSIGKIPQQALYCERWNVGGSTAVGRHDRIKGILRRIPGALTVAKALWSLLARRGRRGLTFVGDY